MSTVVTSQGDRIVVTEPSGWRAGMSLPAASVIFNPSAGIAATNVQAALEELVTDVGIGYVTLGTAQSIAGAKTFDADVNLASAAKVIFGGDTNLYRSAADTLRTDDHIIAGGDVTARPGTSGQVVAGYGGPASEAGFKFGTAGDTNLYRSQANTLKTDDALVVGTRLYVDLSNERVMVNAVAALTGSQTGATASAAHITLASGGSTNRTGVLYRAPVTNAATLMELQNSTGYLLWGVSATGGLLFGGGAVGDADTNLYRVSANRLMTDDDFVVASTVSVGTNNLLGARLQIHTASPSFIGQITRGAASQTATLQEWQDSAGTVLASVAANGDFYVGTTTRIDRNNLRMAIGTNAFDLDTSLYVKAQVTTRPTVVLRGTASQTANLMEFQNSAGTIMSRITSGGLPSNPGGGSWLFAGSSPNNRLAAEGAAHVPLVIAGSSTQTANLQEWQNSAGTILTSVNAAGMISTATNFTLTGVAATGTRYIVTDETSTGMGQLILQAGAGSSGFGGGYNLYGHAHATKPGWTVAGISASSGVVGTATEGRFTVNTWGTGGGVDVFSVTRSGAASIILQNALYVGLTVKGTTAQTANLQEWQNSAGTVLSSINSTGRATLAGASFTSTLVAATANNAFGGAQVSATTVAVHATAATIVPLLLRGAAAQTANLQEWQNNAGTALASVDSIGRAAAVAMNINGFTPGTTYLGVQTVAATVGAIIRGAASQSANLQQWQNSAGVWMSAIDANGSLVQQGDARQNSLNGGPVGNVALAVHAGTAARIPIVSRGVAAQTGDLLQLQNSAGTVLALINNTGQIKSSAGGFGVSVTDTGGSTLAGFYRDGSGHGRLYLYNSALVNNVQLAGAGTSFFQASATSTVPLQIKGIAAQTADLVQLQDSAAAVLASITAAGLHKWSAGNEQTSVGAAGAASALPATPSKYLKVMDSAGTVLVVPAYAAV